MASAESLSVDETNKIRESLGLKPLGESGGQGDSNEPVIDDDTVAEENYNRHKQEQDEARASKELQDRIAKAKNKRDLQAKLSGKGLGEAGDNDDDLDTRKWLKQAKKKAKLNAAALAEKRRKEQEELDAAATASYSEKDLRGLRVAHDRDAFDEGETHVLTLKDASVTGDDADELQNVNMAEYERTNERLDLKKRGKNAYKYTGYDDQEFVEGKAGVLSKYDEEIEGPNKGEGFSITDELTMPIDSKNITSTSSSTLTSKASQSTKKAQQREMLSLDYLKDFGTSDYKQSKSSNSGGAGNSNNSLKLKKKKKSKSSRKAIKEEDEEDNQLEPEAMDVDQKPVVETKRKEYEDAATADADDLQIALARQRREKIKQRRKQNKIKSENGSETPAAENIFYNGVKKEESDDAMLRVEEDDEEGDTNADDGRLVIYDTAEFVRGVTLDKPEERRPSASTSTATKVKKEEQDHQGSALPPPPGIDAVSGASKVKKEEPDDAVPLTEMEVDDNQYDKAEEEEGQVNEEMEQEEETKAAYQQDAILNPADQEPEDGTSKPVTSSRGMLSTLNALRQQGLLKGMTDEEREVDRAAREELKWKASWRKEEIDREKRRLEAREKMTNMTDEQRRIENQRRNAEFARRDMERFKDYKPHVDIKYHDEFGRDLTPQEAWKKLSHRFHGKTSGAAKTEKRLKKIEEERKRERMASGDTPLSTNAAFQQRQEKLGSATMVLSVGNRGAAPQDDGSFLAEVKEQRLSKTDKKGKGKASSEGRSDIINGTQSSVAPSVLPSTAGNESLVPRGFAPVRSTVRHETPSRSSPSGNVGREGTPAGASSITDSGIKIGLASGSKRKASEPPDGSSEPQQKR